MLSDDPVLVVNDMVPLNQQMADIPGYIFLVDRDRSTVGIFIIDIDHHLWTQTKLLLIMQHNSG